MKILKSNTNEIYDTDQVGVIEFFEGKKENLTPLHHAHAKLDIEFLKDFFPEQHRIFDNFGQSYYYVLLEKPESVI